MSINTKGLYRTWPPYIPVAEIVSDSDDYEWNHESPFGLVAPADEIVANRLVEVSNRALVAYSVACAEWVVYRLLNYLPDETPFHYLENFWAFVMGRDEHFRFPPELAHEDWLTAQLGPVDCAISSVMNVIYLSQYYGPPGKDAARIAELAKHVLGPIGSPHFSAWHQSTIHTLTIGCPRSPAEPDGPPLPRALVDPMRVPKSRDWPQWIEREFHGADFSGNPTFVAS
jgi:hypothetical protein